AKNAKILDVGQMVRLKRWLIAEELNGQPLATRRDAFAILDREAGFVEQFRALPEPNPVLSRPVGDRLQISLSEHFIRYIAAEGLKQRKLGRLRLALRHHRRILKDRVRAIVGTIHDVFVGPLEIERIDQCLTNAPILESVSPSVDKPALSTRRRV